MNTGASRVWVLLVAVALLSIGHGLHGSLIGVRATVEAFSQTTTGIIMSGYSAGLLLSSWVTPWMIRTVGHIRVFAGFASVVSTAVLLIPLWIEPAWWFSMRFVSGLCTSGLFIVCESWLNSMSSNTNRGKLLSLYMMVTYGSLGVGQFLLNVGDQSGFSRFILVSALLSFALVPLSLVPTETPNITGARSITIREIFKSSPLAVSASFLAGLAQSAFFAMGAVYGFIQQMPLAYISAMMAFPAIAVIFSQFPVGMISDRYDRRTIILIMAVLSSAVAAIAAIFGKISPEFLIACMTLLGAFSLPIYSLVIAHAADQMQREQMLGASAKLVLLYGLGSMIGPSLVGIAMERFHAPGFMIYMAAVYAFMAAHAFYRRAIAPAGVKAKAGDTMQAGPMTTTIAVKAIAEGKE
jgi:MFS family permease